MNLKSTKNGNNFPFDIIFMLISIQDMLVEEEKQSAFYCILSDKKLEDSDLMVYSDLIQVQVKYLSPAVYI